MDWGEGNMNCVVLLILYIWIVVLFLLILVQGSEYILIDLVNLSVSSRADPGGNCILEPS